MEKGQKILVIAFMFLGLSILIGSYWIGKSIERGFADNSNSIDRASKNITENISKINSSQNDILNQAQAANYLQITEVRLLSVIDSIPHVRIGDQNLFSKNALSEWVEKSNFSANVN